MVYSLALVFLMLIAYFLPTFIALSKYHQSSTIIFIINLFAGWTFFGWVIALVWSLSDS